MEKQKHIHVKERLFLTVLTMILLLSGCGGSDEGGSAASSTPPSSGSARPAPSQDEAITQIERLTLTAYPLKTKGTSELTLVTGKKQSFIAVGEYSNGQSKVLTEELTVENWQSSDADLGEFIQSGVLKGKASGPITVSFSQGNLTSNAVEVKVADAVITDIVVTPSAIKVAKGYHQPLIATATYNNGLSMNISDSVSWVSDDTSTVTVTTKNEHGLLKAGNVGATTISAVQDGVTSNTVNVDVTDAILTTIHVTPTTLTVAKGQEAPLTAMAIYNDGTSSNISDLVNWSVDTSNATVTDNGVLSGNAVGDATVTATGTGNGVTSNTVNVKVSDAVIKSLDVSPTTVSVVKGQSQALTAEATYSDGSVSDVSNSVIWAPIGNKAMITPDGLLSGVGVGTTTLTAFKDGVTSNTIDVQVSDALLTSISVTPTTVSLAKGQTEPLTAMAMYTDGTSSNISDSVSWTSIDSTTASVTPEGLLSGGRSVGTTTLTAFKDGVTSNTIDVDVTKAVMTELRLNPPTVGLMLNATQPMKATAVYSDGSSSDVSDSVTWSAPVNNNTMSVTTDGLVTGLNEGSTSITAYQNGFSRNLDINVCSGDGTNVTGKCIHTIDNSNQLFTTTPSIAYLDSLGLGGSPHTSGTNGMFYTFTQPKAADLCTRYGEMNIFGRTNWRLSTLGEMMNLHRDSWTAQNWNRDTGYYWTSTDATKGHWQAYYKYESSTHYWASGSGSYFKYFASCVSNNP
ncbi:Ig-like domain-containing protein [Vibrio neptunius]|uniref:Ig-like domain-containing protein n=1 Tax=Vibrio neptunius TaxID=170651 RepID=A0ABS3A9E2_9VIBR|nr:Ig-like domain-containing protein [Vibrio neptunius]MBN3495740.1 Ig-like domain-containing protein [Vibrio neptunius]MBN3514521.1 Ig-like domain-containing protein [Vibrio neptunius]MBN3548364.1 Ig-like domain-containing protein [Vibrio neptunius]MBN3580554.1 Ig-like domain-containing protein [Vibrio neptunius]MCH9874221.1 Ig-like domain-containing protein [Vibrio neptunius]